LDNLVDYLSSKGIRTWPAAGPEITAHCFLLCPTDKAKGKLYLNTETWLWDCKRCGTQGGRRRLLEHFGDHDDTTWLPGANPANRLQLLADYTAMASKLLENNEDKLLYLIRRGLSAETITEAQLGYVPTGFSICGSLDTYARKDFEAAGVLRNGAEYHAGRIVIPYQQRDKVIQIRGKSLDGNGRYWTPAGDSVRLYRADTLRGAETAIIAEGEFDALIVNQALRRNPHSPNHNAAVVGLPGAGAWPGGKENFPDYFREAKRVYIALDADDTGIREAEKLKEALGSKARIVLLPTDNRVKVDWTEYLRPADGHHPAGGHDADDIDRLISEAERPGLRLGWKSLDTVLEPGLRPGNICIPMAKTGCIAADAEVFVVRGGIGFRISMSQLNHRYNGGRGEMGNPWDPAVDTYIQREHNGDVTLGKIKDVWYSGRKTTHEITTETGRTVRATDEHPFLSTHGWRRLDQLRPGDLVHVNTNTYAENRADRLDIIGTEQITAIRPHGEEDTYDVEVDDDPHNYIANGFVVHNTGKTVFLANLDYNLRDRRVLHVTLENTVSEMFELLWRIYHFHHPTADDFHISRDMPNLRIVDSNKLSMDDMAMLVEEYTADIGEPPELVNIDYLGYLARGVRGGSSYEKNSEAVMQLKAMAKAHNLAIVSPCQSGRAGIVGQAFNGDEARDSGVIEETCDFMFGLYRPADAADPNGMARGGAVDSEITCQIIKSRRGGKGRVARLHTSPASLVMVDALDAHGVARVQQETAAFNRGLSYEDIARSNREHAFGRAQLSLVSA
jgi:hypothetical protein